MPDSSNPPLNAENFNKMETYFTTNTSPVSHPKKGNWKCAHLAVLFALPVL